MMKVKQKKDYPKYRSIFSFTNNLFAYFSRVFTRKVNLIMQKKQAYNVNTEHIIRKMIFIRHSLLENSNSEENIKHLLRSIST